MSAVEGSILVKAPIGNVYRQWLRVEDFPRFMTAVKEVQRSDASRFLITFTQNGQQLEGLLEIILRVRERRLAWRVLDGPSSARCFATGMVSFAARPDQTTFITLKVTSSFDGLISRRVENYLQNFKELIEKSDGSEETD